MRRIFAICLGAFWIGCTRPDTATVSARAEAPKSDHAAKPASSGDPSSSARPESSAEPSASVGTEAVSKTFDLPPDVDTTRIVDLDVPSDLGVRVLHAKAPLERAIVYLHGMCSTSHGADRWAPLAGDYGTLVMLRAETPCGDRPGNKWTKDPAILQARIDRALDAVRAARGGHLDRERLAILGYSQGAHRAELLAQTYPERYPWVMLGGPPEAALPEHFRGVERLAIFGGELENTQHMRRGAERVAASGVPTRYFVLPGAYHGDYGPDGRRVMLEVLEWALGRAPGSPSGT
jgi:pimeloyl-ACP methyl ester carboxylesterase